MAKLKDDGKSLEIKKGVSGSVSVSNLEMEMTPCGSTRNPNPRDQLTSHHPLVLFNKPLLQMAINRDEIPFVPDNQDLSISPEPSPVNDLS